MKPIKKLQIGKNGLTPEFVNQVRTFFEKERMVKIDILKSACRDKSEAKEIAEKLISELGPKFGYKLIGYVITVTKYRKVQE